MTVVSVLDELGLADVEEELLLLIVLVKLLVKVVGPNTPVVYDIEDEFDNTVEFIRQLAGMVKQQGRPVLDTAVTPRIPLYAEL